MANYLYNGVELPDINEVWTDKTTYPYAVITFAAFTDANTYWLIVSEDEGVYVNSGNYKLRFDCPVIIYQLIDNSWVRANAATSFNTPRNMHEFIWANYDFMTADGYVCIAASDPVPVKTAFVYDKASFLQGLAAGLCGRGVGIAPTAYLYNGVELPALPEYDHEMYPYAVMYEGGLLWLKSERPYRLLENGQYYIYNDTPVMALFYKAVDGEFVFQREYSQDRMSQGDHIFWSNFDVMNADGSLYFAKSDPIPVYE
jgi:hypothetical protein